jgi:hypothetical protein
MAVSIVYLRIHPHCFVQAREHVRKFVCANKIDVRFRLECRSNFGGQSLPIRNSMSTVIVGFRSRERTYSTLGFFSRRYVIPDSSVAVVSLPAMMTAFVRINQCPVIPNTYVSVQWQSFLHQKRRHSPQESQRGSHVCRLFALRRRVNIMSSKPVRTFSNARHAP